MVVARTYGRARLTREGWILDQLEPHVVMRLKQIFPRLPKTQPEPYRLANEASIAADLDWFMQRYPLEMTGAHREELDYGRGLFERNQAELGRILTAEWRPPVRAGVRPGEEIRRYQAEAIAVLERSKGLLLADEVGLGKTVTAAGACLLPFALPAIVVVQPHLQRQWIRAINRFTTLSVYGVRRARPYEMPPVDVLVFRYSQLAGWYDYLPSLRAKLVVFDEVQELRTGSASDKGRAARRLVEHAELKLGLTATPIYNYGDEIHTIMSYLRPEVLGDRAEFFREWCPNGIKEPQALGTYLREQYAMLRRTKADVGQEMPKVNRIVETVPYDQAALDSVEKLARALAIKADTGSFIEKGQAARELDVMVRQATGIAKAPYVAKFVQMLIEAGEPVLLAGWHRAVYDLWLEAFREAGLKPALYTGSETPKQKDETAAAFIRGDINPLIISLRSGAGLDGLQAACSTVVVGELDWSPGIHHQLIGRLDREGQKDPVTAFFLVADDGSDPPMMEVLGLKASEAHHIVDPTLGLQQAHSDVSRLRTLVERYLARRGRA